MSFEVGFTTAMVLALPALVALGALAGLVCSAVQRLRTRDKAHRQHSR